MSSRSAFGQLPEYRTTQAPGYHLVYRHGTESLFVRSDTSDPVALAASELEAASAPASTVDSVALMEPRHPGFGPWYGVAEPNQGMGAGNRTVFFRSCFNHPEAEGPSSSTEELRWAALAGGTRAVPYQPQVR